MPGDTCSTSPAENEATSSKSLTDIHSNGIKEANGVSTESQESVSDTTDKDKNEERNDLSEALAKLSEIQNASNKLLDDDNLETNGTPPEETLDTGIKRKSDNDPEINDLKRPKLGDGDERKVLKRFTRQELEDLVCKVVTEVLTTQTELGEMRKQCAINRAKTEMWQKKALTLQKQCSDLTQVMRRFIIDKSKSKNPERVVPMRITRSVGLQVNVQSSTMSVVTEAKKPPISHHQALTPKQSSTARKTVRIGPASKVNKDKAPSVTTPIVPKLSPKRKASPSSQSESQPRNGDQENQDIIQLSSDDEDNLANPPVNGVSSSTTSIPNNHSQPIQLVIPSNPKKLILPFGSNNMLVRVPSNLPALPVFFNPITGMPSWKTLPPRPQLKIAKVVEGLVLSWTMTFDPKVHAKIVTYDIFACEENVQGLVSSGGWNSLGRVKALPLPMACTLTKFKKGFKYHLTVQATDEHGRKADFADVESILLT